MCEAENIMLTNANFCEFLYIDEEGDILKISYTQKSILEKI